MSQPKEISSHVRAIKDKRLREELTVTENHDGVNRMILQDLRTHAFKYQLLLPHDRKLAFIYRIRKPVTGCVAFVRRSASASCCSSSSLLSRVCWLSTDCVCESIIGVTCLRGLREDEVLARGRGASSGAYGAVRLMSPLLKPPMAGPSRVPLCAMTLTVVGKKAECMCNATIYQTRVIRHLPDLASSLHWDSFSR
jgi:hypothetical protein